MLVLARSSRLKLRANVVLRGIVGLFRSILEALCVTFLSLSLPAGTLLY